LGERLEDHNHHISSKRRGAGRFLVDFVGGESGGEGGGGGWGGGGGGFCWDFWRFGGVVWGFVVWGFVGVDGVVGGFFGVCWVVSFGVGGGGVVCLVLGLKNLCFGRVKVVWGIGCLLLALRGKNDGVTKLGPSHGRWGEEEEKERC